MTLVVRFMSRSLTTRDVDRGKADVFPCFLSFGSSGMKPAFADDSGVRLNGFFPGQKEGAV